MLFFLKNFLLKWIFFCGVTFFWFLIRIIIWREYCPSFLCNPYDGVEKSYDYIVVGAGTAGCIVAMRLAEDPRVSVLLVEAGPTGGSLLDIPAALPLMQLSPLDWQHKTVPQKHAAQGLVDKSVLWPRGKLVGGSGRFNNMMYVRGSQHDYNEWFKEKEDYDYEKDVLYYFKKSEDHRGVYKNDNKYHSTGGPLRVSDLPFHSSLGRAVLESARLLGYPVRDINGEHSTGFTKPQANLKDGARYSTGHYLLDNKPANLKLLTNALVEKILFKDNYEASSILISKVGSKKKIRGNKAIILSAGAIETPKLLMLSGIGKKNDLKKLGIKVVQDLPVGENLQDHITTGVDLIKLKKPLEINQINLLSPYTIYDYIKEGTGPFTSVQCEVIICLYSDCTNAKDFDACGLQKQTPPDLQILVLSLGASIDNGAHLKNILGLHERIWDDYLSGLVGTPTVSIIPVVLKPRSKGFLRLKDNNPHSAPLIDPQYLSEQEDVEVLIKGISFIKKLLETKSFNELGATLYNKTLPGCEQLTFDTHEYWECYVRHLSLTMYHPVGTAKMGQEKDKSSVVGFDFRVIGVNKLFVADASVMPSIPSGNTNAPTAFLAEMAADSVKAWGYLNTGRCLLTHVFLEQNICDNYTLDLH